MSSTIQEVHRSSFNPHCYRTSSPLPTYHKRFDPPRLCSVSGYPIPEIDTSAFLNYLLPPLKQGINVEKVVSSLKSEGLVGRNGAWKDFEVTRRKRTKRARRRAFTPLLDIFEKTTSSAASNLPHLNQSIEMALLPKRRRMSGRRLPEPGGYFFLKDERECVADGKGSKPGVRSWFDVALVADFRKNGIDEYPQNINIKAISNIQRILARDPCRRFSFGITAEDANMRLWFCTRGTPVVSKSFDFTKEPHLLTHIFLSLAFASKEELGWDPTIRPFTSSYGKRAYHIDVGDETYETFQVLAESGAETLMSRATRVWKVKRPGSDDPFVLKDVWLEDDQELEHAIYEMLLHDVEEKYDGDIRREVASHLLTPVAHWLVTVNGEEDHTTKVMMRGYSPTFKQPFRMNVEQLEFFDGEESEVPVSNDIIFRDTGRHALRAPLPWHNPINKVLHRRHYRVVFKEAAKALYLIRDLDDVFTVLSDSARVLQWIHGSDWVHRDISVGNLYLYEGRGLVGDLEFAKRKNSDTAQEQRTGTADFIAVEASMRLYFNIPSASLDELQAELTALFEDRVQDAELMKGPPRRPPFFHNELHDLESLWWISVWELMAYQSVSRSMANPWTAERDKYRRTAFAKLFPGYDETRNRREFLLENDIFSRRFVWMPSRLHSIRAILNTLRETLVDRYGIYESEFPAIRVDAFEGAHNTFERLFARCGESARDVKLFLHEKEDLGIQFVTPHSPARSLGRLSGPEQLQPASANDPSLEIKSLSWGNPEPVGSMERLSRNRKRKREDDDDALLSMPPLQLLGY